MKSARRTWAYRVQLHEVIAVTNRLLLGRVLPRYGFRLEGLHDGAAMSKGALMPTT